jgi:hypothetical protein
MPCCLVEALQKCRHLLPLPRLQNTRKHGKSGIFCASRGPPLLTAHYRAKRRLTNASSFSDDLDGPCRCLATFRATLRSSMNTPPAKLHSRRQDRWHGPLMRLAAGQRESAVSVKTGRRPGKKTAKEIQVIHIWGRKPNRGSRPHRPPRSARGETAGFAGHFAGVPTLC